MPRATNVYDFPDRNAEIPAKQTPATTIYKPIQIKHIYRHTPSVVNMILPIISLSNLGCMPNNPSSVPSVFVECTKHNEQKLLYVKINKNDKFIRRSLPYLSAPHTSPGSHQTLIQSITLTPAATFTYHLVRFALATPFARTTINFLRRKILNKKRDLEEEGTQWRTQKRIKRDDV